MRKVLVMLIICCALCLADDQSAGIHEENSSKIGQQESRELDDGNKDSFPLPPNQGGDDSNENNGKHVIRHSRSLNNVFQSVVHIIGKNGTDSDDNESEDEDDTGDSGSGNGGNGGGNGNGSGNNTNNDNGGNNGNGTENGNKGGGNGNSGNESGGSHEGNGTNNGNGGNNGNDTGNGNNGSGNDSGGSHEGDGGNGNNGTGGNGNGSGGYGNGTNNGNGNNNGNGTGNGNNGNGTGNSNNGTGNGSNGNESGGSDEEDGGSGNNRNGGGYGNGTNNGNGTGNGNNESGNESKGNSSNDGKKCKIGVYFPCPLPCPQTCEFFNKPCKRVPPRCVPDEHGVCGCRLGFVLNKHNICVIGKEYCKQENNSSSGNESYEDHRKCGSNQELFKCGLPCPQTCEHISKKCKKKSGESCGPDVCGCIKGYVRNKKNKCVKAKYYCKQDNDNDNHEDLSKKCRPNQTYYRCGLPCPQTCHYVNEPCKFRKGFVCKPKRDGICGCIKGYVRNMKNKCVPAKGYCDQYDHGGGNSDGGNNANKCSRNEVFYPCGLRCRQTCKNRNNRCENSPRPCNQQNAKCGCIQNFVRNERNKCVEADKYCDHVNEGSNENGNGNGTSNENSGSGDKECKGNQIYYPCGIGCPQTCEYIGKPCYQQRLNCKPGKGVCGCPAGFVRNVKNKCVDANGYCNENESGGQGNNKQCKNPNEQYYPCGIGCPQSCEDIDQPCKEVFCKREKGACLCKQGYVRNKHKKCVRAKEYCKQVIDSGGSGDNDSGNNNGKKCKNPNEQYYPCGIGCPQSCKDLDQPCMNVQCIRENGACLCKKGFVRNNKKKCVKAIYYCNKENSNGENDGNDNSNSDEESGEDNNNEMKCNIKGNEKFYPCGILCPQNCENAKKPCSYIELVCQRNKGMCGCREGYVRDKKNKCVDVKKYCKHGNDNGDGNSGENGNDKQCKRNEQFYPCGVPCGEQTCLTVGKPCNYLKVACKGIKGACGCRDGYVRNQQNKCVRAKGYCNQGNSNEHGGNDNENSTGNESDNESQSNQGQCKKPNEQYYPCGGGCPQSCKDLGKPCMGALVKCKPGNGVCLCMKGYVRNKEHKCVKSKEYCNKGNSNSGSAESGGNSNSNETDSSSQSSEQCKKPNEQYYPCAVGCPQSCEDLGKPCMNALVKCSPGSGACLCKPGYVRNKKGKCVGSKGYCNNGNGNSGSAESGGNSNSNENGSGSQGSEQCKKPNEQYYSCGGGCPQSCEDLGKPCMDALVKCKPGNGVCLCMKGYVRNKEQKCVRSIEYCNNGTGNSGSTESGGNSNSNETGSGSQGEGHGNSSEQCKKPNEQYYPCGVSCPQSCKNLGKPCWGLLVKCILGKGTCHCKPGYVRNNQNKCVSAKRYCNQNSDDDHGSSNESGSGNQSGGPDNSEGNDKRCKNQNEKHYPCGVGCPQSCKELGQPCLDSLVDCLPGKGACLCKPGYVRNKYKKCVSAKGYCNSEENGNDDGRKCSVKRNEKFYPCGIFICLQNCKNVNKLCINIPLCKSNSGICGCHKGYVRNENNKCVDAKMYCKQGNENENSGDHSNEKQCKPDEQFYSCGIPCGAQICKNVGKSCNYLKKACIGDKGACACRVDYVRNKNNKCVRAKDYCNQNNGSGNNNSGDDSNGSGGISKSDKSKNSQSDEGNNDKRCGRNEERLCQPCDRYCGKLNLKCILKRCIHGCYCKSGYARDEHNKCISISKCDHIINVLD